MTTLAAIVKRDPVLARLGAAREALAKAHTIQAAKQIADMAAAAEVYARQQQLGQESIDFAHSIRIEALRRLGELYRESPKAKGRSGPGRGKAGAPAGLAFTDAPTLNELGVSKKTSALAQKLAALPEEQFENVRAGTASVAQAIREVERAKRPSVPLPETGRYRVLYADPPWS